MTISPRPVHCLDSTYDNVAKNILKLKTLQKKNLSNAFISIGGKPNMYFKKNCNVY